MTTHFKKCQNTTNDPWSLRPGCRSLLVSPCLPALVGVLPVGGTLALLFSSPQPGHQDSSLPPEEQILRSRIKEKANRLIRGKNKPLCRWLCLFPSVGMTVHFMCIIYTSNAAAWGQALSWDLEFTTAFYTLHSSAPECTSDHILGAPALLHAVWAWTGFLSWKQRLYFLEISRRKKSTLRGWSVARRCLGDLTTTSALLPPLEFLPDLASHSSAFHEGPPAPWHLSELTCHAHYPFHQNKWLVRINICFPRWLSGKEPACQSRWHRRRGFDPWVGKIHWERKWQPTPVLLPGESHGQRSLAGYGPGSHKEANTS